MTNAKKRSTARMNLRDAERALKTAEREVKSRTKELDMARKALKRVLANEIRELEV